jgi:HlyD family secretion protein
MGRDLRVVIGPQGIEMQSKRSAGNWRRWLAAVVVLAVVGSGGAYMILRGRAAAGSPGPDIAIPSIPQGGVSVEIAFPKPHGIDRVCLQPGTVEPYECADLYAKVSGFLVEQKVDIGYTVRAGDILARISVPEYETQVKQDAADVVRAEARVEQMTAAITTSEADLGAAVAAVSLATAEEKSKFSYREFREKQRNRIKDLVARNAESAKLADEAEDQFQAAVSAQLAAAEAINAARQKEAASRARVKQAQADLKYAQAEVVTAQARLERSRVLLDYTVIRSPYTGVVTKRNFFPGDFIRSADAGGERMPVLAIERSDVMRIIVQVPERDVPFVALGNSARVEVDALPGIVFQTRGTDKVEVSRLAASEDPHTRMMRTEVHVKNPDGKLRRGMFGRVSLMLCPGAAGAFRVPSSALSGKADGGKGLIRLVRGGKAALVPVQIGADNGSEVEVLSGLESTDQVIVRATGPLNEGTIVAPANAPSAYIPH